jgi:hypothetical protein
MVAGGEHAAGHLGVAGEGVEGEQLGLLRLGRGERDRRRDRGLDLQRPLLLAVAGVQQGGEVALEDDVVGSEDS